MVTRIKNAKIITMDVDEILQGDVWIEDDKILSVGQCENGKKADKVLDACGNLIMPGFKNAHTHCPMVFARSLADDLPLERWLNEVIFKLETKLTAEDVYWFTKLAYLEYMAGGITASFNMYYEPQAIVDAAKDMGFRTVLCGAVNDFKESAELLEKYYNRYNNSGDLISYHLGFHAEYTTGRNVMEQISALAHKYQAPVHVHNSETMQEVEQCIKRYGKTPTEVFDELGLYDFGGSGFHSVYLTEKDMEIYKNRGVYAVINACSNMKLASGIAPVHDYMERGIKMAIGTDGASSNNALDMFREMYMISMLQKIVTGNPQNGAPADILRMATVGGADVMGLQECAVLKPGCKADLIMLDMQNPAMCPKNNIINNLVYSGDKSIVKMTMINGTVLYENGCYMKADKEEIISKVEERLGNLFKR